MGMMVYRPRVDWFNRVFFRCLYTIPSVVARFRSPLCRSCCHKRWRIISCAASSRRRSLGRSNYGRMCQICGVHAIPSKK